MRQIVGDRPQMPADLDDMRAVAHEMRGQHLPDRGARARQMRDVVRETSALARPRRTWSIPCHHLAWLHPCEAEAYNTEMTDATQPGGADAGLARPRFDLTRGIAAYSAARWLPGWRASSRSIPTPISPMLSITSRSPARCGRATGCSTAWAGASRISDPWRLVRRAGGDAAGGPRFNIGSVESIDIDPAVGGGRRDPQQGRERPLPGSDGRHVCDRLCAASAPTSSSTPAASTSPTSGHGSVCCRRAQRAAAVERLFQRADPHQLR